MLPALYFDKNLLILYFRNYIKYSDKYCINMANNYEKKTFNFYFHKHKVLNKIKIKNGKLFFFNIDTE